MSQPSESKLISERGLDYRTLQGLLKSGNWKEADIETSKQMLQATGKDSWGNVSVKDLLDFPCQDLITIDSLWTNSSGGKFGFSAQKEVYVKCGANLDGKYPGHDIYLTFCNSVGWCKNNESVEYDQLTYNSLAPYGHLPVLAKIQWWGPGSRVSFYWLGIKFSDDLYIPSLMYKRATCQIVKSSSWFSKILKTLFLIGSKEFYFYRR